MTYNMELIEAVADAFWLSASGVDIPRPNFFVVHIYGDEIMEHARAFIPVAQAPLLDALRQIETLETYWGEGVDANLERARAIARNTIRSTQ